MTRAERRETPETELFDIEGSTVLSAVAQPAVAAAAWNALVRVVPFESLPNMTIRAMPRIYANLRHEPDVAHLSLLKGVYRASWSENALRFAAARPFFNLLNERGIDYRVIKGGALCAIAGNWAVRRMGDIDVVVRARQADAARTCLAELGFHQRAGSDDMQDGIWDSAQGAVIDLHTTRGKPPLFHDMLDEPGVSAVIANTCVMIPSKDVVFAIAVWHARKATSSTDRLQSLIDIASVVDGIDVAHSRDLLVRSDLRSAAEVLLTRLLSLGIVPAESVAALMRRSVCDVLDAVRTRASRLRYVAFRAVMLPATMVRRRLTRDQRRALRRAGGSVSLAYRLWATLGQLRPVESQVCDRRRGFADATWQGGPIPSRDYRIRIPAVAGRPARLRIVTTFSASSPSHDMRALFINGRLHGFMPLPDGQAGMYDVTPTQDFVEVSLRTFSAKAHAPVDGCTAEWCD